MKGVGYGQAPAESWRGKATLRKVFLVGMLVLGEPVRAVAGQESLDLTQLSLQELMQVRISTASRYDQAVQEAPSSVSIVTAEEIRQYGYRTLADILRHVRGFYGTYDRNYSYLGVRGFARPGDYNTRLLLLVNGCRINDNIYDQAAVGTEFPLDVDLIDRVEIVRGPSSSLYGSNAFFGVVNVITRAGAEGLEREASTEAASFDTFKTRFRYGQRWPDGLKLTLSGSRYESAGPGRLYFPEFDDPATSGGIARNADEDRFQSFFSQASWGPFRLQGLYHSREKGIPTAPWGTVFNDPRTRSVDTYGHLDLGYRQQFQELEVSGQLSYHRYRYRGDYAYDFSENGEPRIELNHDASWGGWWGGEVQWSRKWGAQHRGVGGLEYRNNFRQDQKNYGREVYLDERQDSEIWALYLQDEFRPREDWMLSLGLRYDHYDTFGGTLNPRLALIHHPDAASSLKLLCGRAFRAPNVFELYYHDPVSQKINPLLQPETIRTYELAYERPVNDHLQVTASAFYNRIKGLIEQQVDPSDGLIIFKNVGRVRARGLELELQGRWPQGLQGRFSYTFQKAENPATGKGLTNSPRHLARLRLAAPLGDGKLSLGLEMDFMSRRKTLAGGETGGFGVTNVTLLSRDLWPGGEVSASIYNLFDQEYADPAAEEHRQAVIPQDGRTFRLKLTQRF